MAGSLNKIMIIGNLGRDPEMRYTPNGAPVTSFRVACSRARMGQDGTRHEETEWFTVIAWNKLAETCNQYLTKGQKVYVEGRLQTRTWEGADGQKRTAVEIVANELIMLSPKPKTSAGDDGGHEYGDRPVAPRPKSAKSDDFLGEGDDLDPDDLPF